MTEKRKIKIFSAGCPVCGETFSRVRDLTCPSRELVVLDMRDTGVARRAGDLGIRLVPAVSMDAKLADGCPGRGPDEAVLRAVGLGQPLS